MKRVLGAIALMVATASGAVAQDPAPGTLEGYPSVDARQAESAATLTVTNTNWLDVHIYLVRDGDYTSVGVVRSFTTENMQLSSRATTAGGDVRLAADPIGGTGIYVSQSLLISDGDHVEMIVENALSLSSTIVRAP